MNENLRRILANFGDTAETTLVERFRAIIDEETGGSRRWKELEELTGISTHSWQKAYLGKQRPTAEMLEALAQHFPKYAFWMMCGITDIPGQHLCPSNSDPWPSSQAELVKDSSGDLAWPSLIKIKPYLRRFLSNDTLPTLEEQKIEEMLRQLEQRLMVSTVYRQVIIEERSKEAQKKEGQKAENQ